MEPIAIVGAACLFPGASSPAELWDSLLARRDARRKASDLEMGVDPATFYNPVQGTEDTYYCQHGSYLRDFEFDPSGYAVPAEFLQGLDPIFHWSLYVARQALQDSHALNDSELLNRCGVVLGNLSFPTRSTNQMFLPLYHQTLDPALRELLNHEVTLPSLPPQNTQQRAELNAYNALVSGFPASVIAHALGLGATNFGLDAACATSLYAVKLACDYLNSGQADLMLAGAVSGADPFFIHLGFSTFRAFPADATSRPLDQNADGLIAGEGAGMFVLKRHADARRDGDKIYAVIRGIGLSNDGKGKFLLSPNPKGQLLAFQRAYEDAGLGPESIDYVECHATGTPLGDKTEVTTMDSFFGASGHAPLIGSVKSNLGHPLTAAGMAGMLKVILSMQHGQIPATVNVSQPIESPNNVITADHIVTEHSPWPSRHPEYRRAAVSAFGFGGTNAHLVLESPYHKGKEEGESSAQANLEAVKKQKMAIVGMEAIFGAADGLSAFERRIYHADPADDPVPPHRWRGLSEKSFTEANGSLEKKKKKKKKPTGGYLESFDLDFLHFKIPPQENDRPIAQQLLALKVTDKAIEDANLSPGGNVAVIIAMGTELALHQVRGRCDLTWQLKTALAEQGIVLEPEKLAELERLAKDSLDNPAQVNQYISSIGNIMASRVAAKWDFNGPAMTLSAEENSTYKALDVARLMLAAEDVEAVVIGAVDLAGSLESVVLHQLLSPLNDGPTTLSFGQGVTGWTPGEGAGAIVLKRLDTAQAAQDRIYASLEGLSLVHNIAAHAEGYPFVPAPASITRAAEEAMAQAGVSPAQVGYVEANASGNPQEDEAELAGLFQAYRHAEKSAIYPGEPGLTCALGSAKTSVGHTFAAAGMASLIKTALCAYHGYLPATPNWVGPQKPKLWGKGPFFVPSKSQAWFTEQGRPRIAALSGLGLDGSAAHVILASQNQSQTPQNTSLTHTAPYLIPLAGDSQRELRSQLNHLAETVRTSDSLLQVAQAQWQTYQSRSTARYALVLVAKNEKQLLLEIKAAQRGVTQAFEQDGDWATPAGSIFTARPLGAESKIAFVYPGAFNAYPDLGRDLGRLFPDLYAEFEARTGQAGHHLGDQWMFPRSWDEWTPSEEMRHNFGLMQNSVALLEAGISYAYLATQMVQRYFKLDPSAAFGYSLGENTMMFGLSLWSVEDNNSEALRQSNLFKSSLSGEKTVLRQFYGDDLNGLNADDPWAVYIVKAPVQAVKTAVAEANAQFETPRLFLTHINTPNNCVLAGDPEICEAVVNKVPRLGKAHFRAPYSQVIHCPPMASEWGEFVRLNTLPLANKPNLDFYFAADMSKTQAATPGHNLSSQLVAERIATNATTPLDFTKLVQRVYDDGYRVFVELGARNTCTRWIGDSLGEQAHLAVAFDRRGANDRSKLLESLAQLVTHRIPVDLSPLYPAENETATPKRAIVKTITLGSAPIFEQVVTPESQALFAEVKASGAPAKAVAPVPALQAEPPRVIANAPSVVKAAKTPQATQPAPALSGSSGQNGSYGVNGDSAGPKLPVLPSPPPPPPSPSPKAPTGRTVPVSPKAQNTSQTAPRSAPQASQLAEQSQDHAEFLKNRQQAWQNLKTSLRQRLAEQTASTPTPAPALVGAVEVVSPPAVSPGYDHGFTENYSQPETVIWDEADLLEFAEGKIANVFGPEYSVIDSYSRQVRLPMPPYLLVSRVTDLDATRDAYRRSYIQTEYDIPLDAWYAIDGQTPLAVAIESGQCDLLLISYIGIDFQAKGVRVYRLLDCTLTFMDELPKVGETLRYDIWINSFAQSGDNLLFFFNYECFIGDKLVLKMDGGCAGFFTDEELDRGKGIIFTEKEKAARAQIERQFFTPPLRCEQTQFSQEELFLICEGRIAECFGPQYGQAPGVNRSLRFPDPGFMMLDEVTSLDPQGGPWGLGLVEGRKFLAPDDWYFPCHFKDDEVLAGSLMAQGCAQLLQFYMLYLGLHSYTVDARFQAVQELPQVVRCRGQVTPTHEDMIYQMEVKDISLRPRPTVIANVAVLFKGKMIVLFEDLAFELREKDPQNELAPAQVMELAPPPPAQYSDAGPPAFDEADIDNFALGSIEACFGPEFAIYNTLRAPRTPNGYLQLISRVQETVGRLREFTPGSYVSTETDLPSEAWFGEDNNHPAVMPYSVYMELGLQPCGFLSAFLGSSMIYQDTGLYFRNLDGDGIILKDGDWRGKTLTNKATLVSSTAFNHTVLQKFEFELGYQGEPVYKGSASFGYFTEQALADQLGLDRGQKLPAWLAKEGSQWPQERINLRSASDRRRFYVAPADKPFYKLADNRLDLLDEVVVVPGGGSAGEGYIYAEAEVVPETWFFTNHFHEDPVMPGSLGVEAIMQAMQAYALHQNLGAEFNSPRFAQVSDHKIVWKYRGQIVRESETMSLDFHLTRLERQPGRLILIGQANLWRDGLRIYEVSEVALAIEETN